MGELKLMDEHKFPKTYGDLDEAPWCDSYEKPDRRHGWDCFIYIKYDWFPEEYGDRYSAFGSTLKEALLDLQDLWREMRPPQ